MMALVFSNKRWVVTSMSNPLIIYMLKLEMGSTFRMHKFELIHKYLSIWDPKLHMDKVFTFGYYPQ
jgi:hypothetical protein